MEALLYSKTPKQVFFLTQIKIYILNIFLHTLYYTVFIIYTFFSFNVQHFIFFTVPVHPVVPPVHPVVPPVHLPNEKLSRNGKIKEDNPNCFKFNVHPNQSKPLRCFEPPCSIKLHTTRKTRKKTKSFLLPTMTTMQIKMEMVSIQSDAVSKCSL